MSWIVVDSHPPPKVFSNENNENNQQTTKSHFPAVSHLGVNLTLSVCQTLITLSRVVTLGVERL